MADQTPSIGASAETQDGVRLGVIAEVVGDYLRINPHDSDAASFWLEANDLAEVTEEVAQFDFPHDILDRRVVPVPPDAVGTEPTHRAAVERDLDERRREVDRLAGGRSPDS